MAEKKERKYVNPKWLLRQIMRSLPAEQYVRSTVAALWTFSNGFIEKNDIASGTVWFNGTLAYSQLADFCAIGESTAKWRMVQLRDKWELVEWEPTKYGIKFTFGVSLSADGERRSAKQAHISRPAPTRTDDWVEKFNMPLTPPQKACERRTGHNWTEYLHTMQQCSACGRFRTKPKILEWTAVDELEVEYMAWLEEDAPDNWNPFESLWAYPRQHTWPTA